MEKVVRVFRSLDEADEADARVQAVLTPEERIELVMTLRDLMHPDAAQQGIARVCRVIELEQC